MIPFTQPVTRRRAEGDYNARGHWIERAPAEDVIAAAIVPTEGEQRELLPGGVRRVGSYRVFTRADLRAASEDSSGDEVFIGGRYLRVVAVERWHGPHGGFNAATLEASS